MVYKLLGDKKNHPEAGDGFLVVRHAN